MQPLRFTSGAYWSTSALTLFRQNATKKITEPVAVPLDFEPERCTMTMKPEISTRASLIPILRPGSLLLSDTCQSTTGSEGEKCRPLDHMGQIPFVLTARFRRLY